MNKLHYSTANYMSILYFSLTLQRLGITVNNTEYIFPKWFNKMG